MNIIKNMNTLKAMKTLGFIAFTSRTGEKITGLCGETAFTCYYVDSAVYGFIYKGKKYCEKYMPGCFYPYVVEIN